MAERGIEEYRRIGVASEKLILGVPWYGYRYPCEYVEDSGKGRYCEIKKVPFRGVNCSDAAGSEIAFKSIQAIWKNHTEGGGEEEGGAKKTERNITGVRVDAGTLSPYFQQIGGLRPLMSERSSCRGGP